VCFSEAGGNGIFVTFYQFPNISRLVEAFLGSVTIFCQDVTLYLLGLRNWCLHFSDHLHRPFLHGAMRIFCRRASNLQLGALFLWGQIIQ
jgi:hypothetical protein